MNKKTTEENLKRIDWNALETAWAKQYEADYIKGEVDATV